MICLIFIVFLLCFYYVSLFFNIVHFFICSIVFELFKVSWLCFIVLSMVFNNFHLLFCSFFIFHCFFNASHWFFILPLFFIFHCFLHVFMFPKFFIIFQLVSFLFIVFQCFSLCFIVFKWCSLFFIIIFSLFFNVFNLFWLSVFHLCSVLHYVSIVFQNSPGHNNWSALKWQKFNKFPRFFFDDLHLIPFIVSQCSTEYVSVFSKFLGTVNLRVAICPPPLLDPMHNMWSREKQHITTNSLKILGQTRSPSSHKCSLHGPAVPAL